MILRLIDLDPRWLNHGGEEMRDVNGAQVPLRAGVGLSLRCPGACGRTIDVLFENPLDGGAAIGGHYWARAGETFDTLTLRPSLLHQCGWHGYLTDGEIKHA